MNLTSAVMLVNKAVRPVKVEYDPDNQYNNKGAMIKFFKCLDPEVKKDDLVIVETSTRHGFTVAKVVEVDFPVDFNDPSPWGWIAQRFNKDAFKDVKEIEDKVKHRVAIAQENKMRKELADAAGLGDVAFDDLMLMAPTASAPTFHPATPPPAPLSRTIDEQRRYDRNEDLL